MATVQITYCGMDGAGRTVTEAKKDAARKLEQLVSRAGIVRVISAYGASDTLYQRIITGDCEGWRITCVTNGEQGGTSFAPLSDSLDDVERSERRHLGSLATDWLKCFDERDVHPVVEDHKDRMEVLAGCRWQRRIGLALT